MAFELGKHLSVYAACASQNGFLSLLLDHLGYSTIEIALPPLLDLPYPE